MCKSVHISSNGNTACNNCGKLGHMFHQCKVPITSYGVILYKRNTNKEGGIEFLMIRRKNSFGFIDFMRGKYNVNDVEHLKIMFDEMSLEEKGMIMENSFYTLWREMWGISEDTANNSHHRTEENMSRKKFECLANRRSNSFDLSIISEKNMLQEYVENSSTAWIDTEWEFPKGRKDSFEKDLECAVREFEEETGIKKNDINVIDNLLPFEEYFIGSNKKSYKYKYFLAEYTGSLYDNFNNFQPSEVSKMEWKTFNECMNDIRPYYECKKQIIRNIYSLLHLYNMVHI